MAEPKQKGIYIRLTDELHAQLKSVADTNKRSLQGEAELAIELHVKQESRK